MLRELLVVLAAALAVAPVSAAAAVAPSGERQVGQSLVEPAIEDMTGQTIYLLTPMNAPFPVKASDPSWAPIYIVVYPAASSAGPLNCQNNCPSHDDEIASLTHSFDSAGIYASGIKGHDHILHAPGPPGGMFNVNWEIHLVLFTDSGAANTRVTTLDQLNNLKSQGKVIDIDTDTAFICAVVPARVYQLGTPPSP